MHRNIDLDAVPDGRTVLQFHFPDVATANAWWWLRLSTFAPVPRPA
jgi:hypothetical protein